MKKMVFKKLMNILDSIEIQGILTKDIPSILLTELKKDTSFQYDVDIKDLIDYLLNLHLLKETHRGIDLSPIATVFGKADANSRVEALALFECLYQHVEKRKNLSVLFDTSIHKVDLYHYFDEISYSLCMQSSLFFIQDDYVKLRKEYIADLHMIMKEYDEDDIPPLISNTLCAYYTSSIVAHENKRIEYKNRGNSIVPYKHLQSILHIIPRRGVPNDRNETKALQSFYKDTLFHESNHVCPICNIDIAHMLIASHIKPFRDCAHIYEAIDHNNGLLLCRNHDYLFDQGYISFEDDGKIMISKELRSKESLQPYFIDQDYSLPSFLLTRERRLFLVYHRKNIYKDAIE